MSVLRKLAVAVAVLAGVVGVLLVLMIDTSASVKSSASEQIGDADTVNHLLNQIQTSISDRHNQHTIKVSQKQVASLVGFVQRAAPYIRGNVDIASQHSQLQASMALPVFAGHLYINVDMRILPDDKFTIDYIEIGNLYIPGGLAVGLVEHAINMWTDSDIGTQARQQISRVSMQPEEVAVTVEPMDRFLRELNEVRSGLGNDSGDELTELTGYYLRYIAGRELALKKKPQPFHLYLRQIMARAREQSNQDNVLMHNKAAVLALSIFIGHHRIANFVGDVQPDIEHALKPAAPPLLRGRNDLAKHFIISAALKMLSEQDVTFAIGEFKELMDRGMGGSGYSFVDLTADLAGLELARVLGDPETALATQNALASAADEGVYMPTIEGLTEGLSKQEFDRRYEKVDSEAYLNEVARIKARLSQIPLYQQATE
ncbi:hypothetical protein [Salinimonas sediminis]|uniref:Uncharacterized protein n=1 Tax=Salinimonas sediminis TaxID=2303538 RepID=A0A346NII9_9ALTE|nr:hypothetical protein [Salinimonas sediminis]AXR05346.1 hypothetical protein D0Y50_02570 [Salinimonas sediminis]